MKKIESPPEKVRIYVDALGYAKLKRLAEKEERTITNMAKLVFKKGLAIYK